MSYIPIKMFNERGLINYSFEAQDYKFLPCARVYFAFYKGKCIRARTVYTQSEVHFQLLIRIWSEVHPDWKYRDNK